MRVSIVLALLVGWFGPPGGAQVRFSQDPGRVQVTINDRPFTTFYLAPGGNKPYLYPLSTANGLVVTRHFPMEEFPGETKDHPHHRGLFFSHGDINGYNFWATEPGSNTAKMGRMILKSLATSADGAAKVGTIHAVFEGQDSAGKGIMKEDRTIRFYSDREIRMLDYEIQIDPIEQLTFADTKEGTFGIRLATSMTEDKGAGGRMVNAEGAATEKNVWGKRSPWVDYYGPVEGKTVGVAIFDHPGNPRYPTYWHSRAYGLFAANPFGVHDFTGDPTKDGSLTVKPGQTLRFRYRVLIHLGDVHEAKIAELYKNYASQK